MCHLYEARTAHGTHPHAITYNFVIDTRLYVICTRLCCVWRLPCNVLLCVLFAFAIGVKTGAEIFFVGFCAFSTL